LRAHASNRTVPVTAAVLNHGAGTLAAATASRATRVGATSVLRDAFTLARLLAGPAFASIAALRVAAALELLAVFLAPLAKLDAGSVGVAAAGVETEERDHTPGQSLE